MDRTDQLVGSRASVMRQGGAVAVRVLLVLSGLTAVAAFWTVAHRHGLAGRLDQVLLISIDTCRPDHLGCYGGAGAATPNLDALAEQAVRFTHAYSPVPMTLPAHSSILTGLYPPRHGVRDNFEGGLSDRRETLAERFRRNGYATGAVVSSFILDSRFGLGQGFDFYDDRFEDGRTVDDITERTAEQATRRAVAWLTQHRGERFFFLLHYYDPHARYIPPEPYKSRFPSRHYTGEIAYTDHCIGQVFDALKKMGLFESMTIIVTADHGEMLGEHGEDTHDFFIYESALRIPLIVKLPGHHRPLRRDDLVSLVDIAPTLCSLSGVGGMADAQGRDLSAVLHNQAAVEADRALYCECMTARMYNANPLYGVITRRFKYIQTTHPELYDLVADPQESNNLASANAAVTSALADQLHRWRTADQDAGAGLDQPDGTASLDRAAIEKIHSLGYVGDATAADGLDLDPNRDDPKDLIGFHQSNRQVIHAILEGRYDEAEQLCRELLARRPDFFGGYLHLARIAVKRRDFAAAATAFDRALVLRPDSAKAHNGLGFALVRQRRYEQAVKQFDIALKHDPDNAESRVNMAIALRSMGRLDQALVHLHQAVRLSPADSDAQYNLGLVLMGMKRYDAAAAAFRATLDGQPDHLGALNGLAKLLATMSDPRARDPVQAIRLAKRASSLSGGRDPGVLDTLAAAYASAGDYDRATRTAERALQLATSAGADVLATTLKRRVAAYRRASRQSNP